MSKEHLSRAIVPAQTHLPQLFIHRRSTAAVIASAVTAAAVWGLRRAVHQTRTPSARPIVPHADPAAAPAEPVDATAAPSTPRLIYRRVTVIEVWRSE